LRGGRQAKTAAFKAGGGAEEDVDMARLERQKTKLQIDQAWLEQQLEKADRDVKPAEVDAD